MIKEASTLLFAIIVLRTPNFRQREEEEGSVALTPPDR